MTPVFIEIGLFLAELWAIECRQVFELHFKVLMGGFSLAWPFLDLFLKKSYLKMQIVFSTLFFLLCLKSIEA